MQQCQPPSPSCNTGRARSSLHSTSRSSRATSSTPADHSLWGEAAADLTIVLPPASSAAFLSPSVPAPWHGLPPATSDLDFAGWLLAGDISLPESSSYFHGDQSLSLGLLDMGNLAHTASAGSSAPPSHDSNTPDAYPNPEDVSPETSPQAPGPPSLDVKVRKRERNTAAARRYRQKRQDRITELEQALAEVTKERDELRIRLARQEAQTATLRDLMGMSAGAANGSNSRG